MIARDLSPEWPNPGPVLHCGSAEASHSAPREAEIPSDSSAFRIAWVRLPPVSTSRVTAESAGPFPAIAWRSPHGSTNPHRRASPRRPCEPVADHVRVRPAEEQAPRDPPAAGGVEEEPAARFVAKAGVDEHPFPLEEERFGPAQALGVGPLVPLRRVDVLAERGGVPSASTAAAGELLADPSERMTVNPGPLGQGAARVDLPVPGRPASSTRQGRRQGSSSSERA